jgi:epoxyqueuosine reductase
MNTSSTPNPDFDQLATDIRAWAAELGFNQIGITDTDLDEDAKHLRNWLAEDRHGEMEYMRRHASKRSQPEALVAGTQRIISVRMDYLPHETTAPEKLLEKSASAYLSRYALGRDYHKLMRRRLQRLADKITDATGTFGYRAFVDSAPVLEKALARNAGLGWIGKHTNLINKNAGSWFFLGELFTDLPLPIDTPATDHCGSCAVCIDVCPTAAIVAPYELDARRCISYLTIELRESIPVELRPLMGNRIYGCDDCQLFCPWNKFAEPTAEGDFAPRHGLDTAQLEDLFSWSEQQWLDRTTGSAIRRIGFQCWLRNIAVALGNAEHEPGVIKTLRKRSDDSSALVREHVEWAIQEQLKKASTAREK